METSDLMSKALKAEAAAATGSDGWRLAFHLMPPIGWLNDPNGLCQCGSTNHIFFQYNPLGITPMKQNYWGHYATDDFVNYTYYEPGLCCDDPADSNGVYSGSAVVENDQIRVYYTGNVKHPGNHDYTHTGREHNTMTAVSDDGIHFHDKEVLLRNSDYPQDDTLHVRDPKVFTVNGKQYMVLGARRNDDVGEVLVFGKTGAGQWELINRLTTPDPFGYMWECPDLYTLDGHTFLSISPQGIEPKGYRYNNVYQSGTFHLIGDFRDDYALEDFTEYDRGFDFYAPQTYEDNQGRRILIGWMGLPDIPYQNPTADRGWVHALTIPRVLTVNEDGVLCQNPLPEFDKLRQWKTTLSLNGQESGWKDSDCFDAVITPENGHAPFSVTIRKDCVLDWDGSVFTLSFGPSGYGRDSRKVELEAITSLRILCDTSSIEIFLNDGSDVFTSRFYPDPENTGINIKGLKGSADIWTMNSFNITKN